MASNTWKVLLFSTFVLLVDLSAGQTLPDLSECGRSVGCFRNPPNCMTSDNCTSVVRWYKTNDSNYIGFDLMAVSDGWVAVGLSMDKLMVNNNFINNYCVNMFIVITIIISNSNNIIHHRQNLPHYQRHHHH